MSDDVAVTEEPVAGPRASQLSNGRASSVVSNSSVMAPRTSASLATPRVTIPNGTTSTMCVGVNEGQGGGQRKIQLTLF